MKITLRKAHRLVKELQSKVSVRFEQKDVHHSATDDEVRAVVAETQSASFQSVEKALKVQEAIFDIRKSLQDANAKDVDGNTVDSLLNRKVLVEAQMKVLSSFREPSKTKDEEVLNKILREVKDNHESTSEYRSTYTRVSGLSSVMHDNLNTLYVTLKQEQETVSDKLAYINNKLEIEVDDKYKELFKELQVL
ncbi:hypothetical protein pEaSNUABM50_00377 [Erwinia phage pEa_SNUABM_50]|uniref:Uncharacterized protein n=4 Tax=Eneladusvirus BF TaxID=2560751 RepID=A0A7L8ZNY0_9CAUD|nr:hypothetical protein FDH34_gp541 [Serratia phage BF]QOI71317.1 hypothetical protein pEaSNUABM12_00381 [Erwinia phage pEa_SNUABM_12]QOI71860.1 hypothetical protein pEaSNUABM47_00378 [Erwinia phage pEa_SNUABM_47]QOI72399.1 hypothetical protein pEaSNUABM50_00377 [Erwinia phage pEa_SNUABM_50]QXO11526.1 hypothetical protein pEaSNUABM19_00382 [Erwinia phage pEa_SNUABM_19]QXO12627.1 hypothetical protein pEaSNUABM49_00383 [Erwinia phage pEa_SNUABM_49]